MRSRLRSFLPHLSGLAFVFLVVGFQVADLASWCSPFTT
jgi:hypothetical protein